MSHRSQVSGRTIWWLALHGLLIAVLAVVLYRARTVVAWAAIALTISLALDPLIAWMERKGLRRGIAVLIVFLVGVGCVGGALALVIPMLVEQGRNLIAAAPDLLERLRDSSAVHWLDARYDIIDRAKDLVANEGLGAAGYLMTFLGGVFTGLLAALTVVVLSAFMLLWGPRLVNQALEVVEPSQRDRCRRLLSGIRTAVGGYVAGAVIIASIGGVVTAVVLVIVDVPYYAALGIAMLVLGLIPYLGATFGGILVIGTSFLAGGTTAGLVTLVVFIVYQQAENHLLQPLVQRRTIHMNPLLIVLAMLAGTALLGVLGAFLALPTVGAVQVIVRDLVARRQASWTEELLTDAPRPQPSR